MIVFFQWFVIARVVRIVFFLVGLVDIDSVIARASRFNKEDIFRRLLELNLRYPRFIAITYMILPFL